MAGTGKKLWDNRDSGLRYEEHLNGSPLVIQHTISIFTLRVKVKRRWTYLFYKKAADAAGCLSQSSPLSLHSRAWQTLKNVARKKKSALVLALQHVPGMRTRASCSRPFRWHLWRRMPRADIANEPLFIWTSILRPELVKWSIIATTDYSITMLLTGTTITCLFLYYIHPQ